jgi:nicotinate phosphoribosyltransferase
MRPSPEKALVYNQSLALLTDLYQLTMVYGYWKSGLHAREAVFHLNFRKWPFKGGFAIAAGLETAVRFLEEFRFSATDLSYLRGLKDSGGNPLFEKEFLEFLSRFEFSCDVDAMPEGTLAFPYEPILRVKGPIWQAQLLESPLLNIVNFQTLIATKAARICLAARPDPVIEFGMRRAQGIDGAISASRAAYIGGCFATSDVIAGKLFGIPVRGTHAHSWVMAFDDEAAAFETFAKILPKGCVMLIDTYDSVEGVKRAIQVAKRLAPSGFMLDGVRLDSGDLACLSIEIRKILDREGFSKTEIMASNELDEYLIRDLKQQGAKITVWGVGTHLVTGKDQPALDGIYKLSAIQNEKGKWEHKLKLSEQTAKVTNPGILQVRRFFDGSFYLGDAIYDELLGIPESCTSIDMYDPNGQMEFPSSALSEDLLVPVFRKGKVVADFPPLSEIQEKTKMELARLPPAMERFTNPQPYHAGLEKGLYRKKLELIKKLRKTS